MGLSLAACHSNRDVADISAIEVRTSGLRGNDIIVHANGQGEMAEWLTKTNRQFGLKPAQFQKLASELRPYRRYARPVTDKSVWKSRCSSPAVDAGTVYLRWQALHSNVHYVVDLGCSHWWQSHRRLFDTISNLERDALTGSPHS
jgi:hypothetical protein